MKTQAVIFPEVNKFEIIQLELEKPGARDLVVKTLVSAISPGTERWILCGKHVGTQFPCVPGYHRIGIVEKCGKEVSVFQPGDIVYGTANRWQSNIISMWGAHVGRSVGNEAEYRFIASSLPNRLELESMAFSILAAVANRGVRFSNIRSGQQVLIIGAGFIGICAAQLASLRGAHPVLLEKDKSRINFVKKIAPKVLSADEKNLEKMLKELAPAGFDLLYDTAGHAPTTNKMVQHLKHQGTLLLQAQYFDRERSALDLDQIKIREIMIKTTCYIDDQDWAETTNNIRRRFLKIAPLITHRFEALEAIKGYELLSSGQPFNLGIVFRWDERVK